MSDLRNRVEDLSTAEKIELLDSLWESLDTGGLPLTEDQRGELDYRIARHDQHPSDVIPTTATGPTFLVLPSQDAEASELASASPF